MKLDEGELAALLERYTAAMAIHQQCLRTLIDAMLRDDAPTSDLATKERRAHDELTAARKRLIQALSGR